MVHSYRMNSPSTMGQVHHGSATMTAAIRRAIQHGQESLRALANQKTVAKWRKRISHADLPTAPREIDGAVDRGGGRRGRCSGAIRYCRSTTASTRADIACRTA